MTEPILKDVDANPLVQALMEKTQAGRLVWEATADEGTFIASVGGNATLKLVLESQLEQDVRGNPEYADAPTLLLLDEKGKKQWQVYSSQVEGGLWVLYRLAQRVANKVDDRMAALVEAVQRL